MSRPWHRLVAAAPLGVLGVPRVAWADHPTNYAGGLWPLVSLVVLLLGFAVMWGASVVLERWEKPRTGTRDP